MSLARKVRRAKELKLRKEARKIKKAQKQIENMISSIPDNCDECGVPFDRTDVATLNEWRIAVYDDGVINLVCPSCVPEDVKDQKREVGS